MSFDGVLGHCRCETPRCIYGTLAMVVVVAALHLRLVLHLGMVLAVLMRLMQPVFCNGASGIAGRALRRIFWGNLGIG